MSSELIFMDDEDETKPVLKIVGLIVGIILVMLAFVYSYTQHGFVEELVSKIVGDTGRQASETTKIDYIDTSGFMFKKSTKKQDIPIIDLDKPNAFSTFNLTIVLIPQTPIVGTMNYLNVTLKSGDEELLTLNYTPPSGEFPTEVTFTNIKLPVDDLNTKVDVYLNLLSDIAYMSNKKIDSFYYNSFAKYSTSTAGVKAPKNEHTIFVPLDEDDTIKNEAGAELPEEGSIIVKYPLIGEYYDGLHSLVTEDLKELLSPYYVSPQTFISIRGIVENTLIGSYTVYGYLSGDVRLEEARYDSNAGMFMFKFTPIYNVKLKVPYAVLRLDYKVDKIVTSEGGVENYFMLTGYESDIEYVEIDGYSIGKVEDLFKSISLTLNVVNERGFVENLELGSFDIVTRQAIISNDVASAYLDYVGNTLSIDLLTPITVSGINLDLSLQDITSHPDPYIIPKVYYVVENKIVKQTSLPSIKLNKIVYYPSETNVVRKNIEVIHYDSIEIENYFIPYKLINDEDIIGVIVSDLMMSPYVPIEARNLITEKVITALSPVEPDSSLIDTITSSRLKLVGFNDKVGFQPVLEINVELHGVTLSAVLNSLIIKEGDKVLYAEVTGLDLSIEEGKSITTSIKYTATWDDFKYVTVELDTSSDGSFTILKKDNSGESKVDSVIIKGYEIGVDFGDGIEFEHPLPYDTLPKIKVSNVRLLEKYNIKLPILDSENNVIYEGDEEEVINKNYYIDDAVFVLYSDVYEYHTETAQLIENDNYFMREYTVREVGYFTVNSDGTITEYNDDGVSISKGLVKVEEEQVEDFRELLDNNFDVYIYVIGEGEKGVIYEELKVDGVSNNPEKNYIVLRSIASDGYGDIEVVSDSKVTVIEGYYSVKVYLWDANKETIQAKVIVKSNNGDLQLFTCTVDSCVYELGSDYWALNNSYYTPDNTVLMYDGSTNTVELSIVPIVMRIDNNFISEYNIIVEYEDSECVKKSLTYSITPAPRRISVGVSTENLGYLSVEPVMFYYSLDYNDLFALAMVEYYDIVRLILSHIKISVVEKYEHWSYYGDYISFFGDDGNYAVNMRESSLFKYEEVEGNIYIYPDINYDGAEHPRDYEVGEEGVVLVFLPMVAKYEVSIVGVPFVEYSVTVTPVKNKFNLVFYEISEGNDLVAGQTVTAKFTPKINNVPNEIVDAFLSDLSKNTESLFKAYMVSQAGFYYPCSVEEVSIEKDINWVVITKLMLPSSVPDGVYSFTLIHDKFEKLYTSLKSFEELTDENYLNKFFVKSGIDFDADLLFVSGFNGLLIYGANSGELYKVSDELSVKNLGMFIPSEGSVKFYPVPNDGELYMVYPHEGMKFYVPVYTYNDLSIDELANYFNNVYLISLNLPGFEGYTPENYVKRITLAFSKGDVDIDVSIDVTKLKKTVASKLFVKVVDGETTFYYLPVSITPYYMTYIPDKAELSVEIELINGVIIKREVELIPIIIHGYESNGKTVIETVCGVSYYKKLSGSGFKYYKIPVGKIVEDNIVVTGEGLCDFEYANAEIPIGELLDSKVDLTDLSLDKVDEFIQIWNEHSKLEKAYAPTLYTLAGGLIFYPSSVLSGERLFGFAFYTKLDVTVEVKIIMKVSSPDYELVKEWVKENGVTVNFEGVTFRVIATKYKSETLLFVYAKSNSEEALFTIDVTALTSFGSAQISFNGQDYYITVDGVSHSLGVLRGVRIGVK